MVATGLMKKKRPAVEWMDKQLLPHAIRAGLSQIETGTCPLVVIWAKNKVLRRGERAPSAYLETGEDRFA